MPTTVTKKAQARGKMQILRLPLAASQTFKAGDFLAFNSSGLLIQGVAASANLPSISGLTGLVVGRALEDAVPATGDVTLASPKQAIAVVVAEPGTQFLVPLYHATATSAYMNTNNFTVNYEVGNITFPAGAGGNTMYAIDIGHTTNVKARIVDIDATDNVTWPDIGQTALASTGTTTQYPGVWIEFLASACAVGGAGAMDRT